MMGWTVVNAVQSLRGDFLSAHLFDSPRKWIANIEVCFQADSATQVPTAPSGRPGTPSTKAIGCQPTAPNPAMRTLMKCVWMTNTKHLRTYSGSDIYIGVRLKNLPPALDGGRFYYQVSIKLMLSRRPGQRLRGRYARLKQASLQRSRYPSFRKNPLSAYLPIPGLFQTHWCA